ncbi:hypothetical protein VKT23_012909 [Stygiomarasmius scandens]|uniref:Uncharacterized protein n=1 Tax=Marasmiellus scandens TaxID=2682957 RepID=A0ABR1J7E0_9AGAR
MNNDSDHEEESVAHTATRRAGRKSEYWSTEQLALLGKHSATFLACVEEHKADLLGKNDRKSWPKPLSVCLEAIQKELFADEKMRAQLGEGIRKASGERSLSREDLDHNKEQETKNKQMWKQKVKNFYKNKLRDYRKEHSSEGTKPEKDDQSAYELLKKVLLTSFGPRDLFAQENADEIRKCRDKLVAEKPELQSNNGAPYQMAISKLWATADQASYAARAKDQFTNLDRDEDKLSRALHWFLNALSPKLGEVEMKLIYAFRHNGGGISMRSVDAACKSRTNFEDKFETNHEESWGTFSTAFMQWADKHIPRPKKAVLDIPTDLEGIPVFPKEKTSDLTVMKDILNAYFKALWFRSWPADLQTAAIPWSEVVEHPEDYYDLNQLPKGNILQSPDSMRKADVVTWFEYFEERPRDIPPFVFFPKARIEGRLRTRQMQALEELHAGEEFADDESVLRSSSPALETTNTDTEELAPTATSSITPRISNGSLDSSKSTSTPMDDNKVTTPIATASSLSSSTSHGSETHVSHDSSSDMRIAAVSDACKEDSSPPADRAPSRQMVQEQVALPSLTIRVPPIDVWRSTEKSMDVTQEVEKEKKGKGKGRKGENGVKKAKNTTANTTRRSDRPGDGEGADRNAQAGGRRKRKVDSVEEPERQGDRKHAKTAGISRADVGATEQPGQRRSNRIKSHILHYITSSTSHASPIDHI